MSQSSKSLHKIDQFYPSWREAHFTEHSQKRLKRSVGKNYLFTVFVETQGDQSDPSGNSPLDQTINSLHSQTYRNIEVLLCCKDVDKIAQNETFHHWKEKIQSLRGLACFQINEDPLSHFLDSNHPICRGDYLLCIKEGTTMEDCAFDLLNRAINEQADNQLPEVLVIDHEYVNPLDAGSLRPYFFPGWDPDLMTQIPGLGSACAISRELASMSIPMSKSNDHLCPSMSEQWISQVSKYYPWPKIAHIPSPVIRFRSDSYPCYRSDSKGKSAPPQGGISIVIPNKDNPHLLQNCLKFLRDQSVDCLELIIVDNGSTNPTTAEYYEELRNLHRAKVITKPGIFNYSRMINAGVDVASQEFLLLLNNDVIIPDLETLWDLTTIAALPEVGVVGSILLYPDHTVQHAGILLFPGPSASHVMRYAHEDDPGPGDILKTTRNYQAVTGALQVMRTDLFREIHGYDEVHLPIEFNDVDFCLRVREKGLKVLCAPMKNIIHAESSTRQIIDSVESDKSRKEAKDYMLRRWKNYFYNDPFMNPNLSISDSKNLGLKLIER